MNKCSICKAYTQENGLNIVTKGKNLIISIPKHSRFISLYINNAG